MSVGPFLFSCALPCSSVLATWFSHNQNCPFKIWGKRVLFSFRILNFKRILVLLHNYFRGFEFEIEVLAFGRRTRKKEWSHQKDYLCGSSLHPRIEKFVEVREFFFVSIWCTMCNANSDSVFLYSSTIWKEVLSQTNLSIILLYELSLDFDNYNRPYNFAFNHGLSK